MPKQILTDQQHTYPHTGAIKNNDMISKSVFEDIRYKLRKYNRYINLRHREVEKQLNRQKKLSEGRVDHLTRSLDELKAMRQEISLCLYKVNNKESTEEVVATDSDRSCYSSEDERESNKSKNKLVYVPNIIQIRPGNYNKGNNKENNSEIMNSEPDKPQATQIQDSTITDINSINTELNSSSAKLPLSSNTNDNTQDKKKKKFYFTTKPLIITEDYFKKIYCTSLLSSHINTIPEFQKPIEEVEVSSFNVFSLKIDDFLLFKKVIGYYLHHIVKENIELLSSYVIKLSLLNIDSDKSLQQVYLLKEKFKAIKERFLANSIKMIYARRKKEAKKTILNTLKRIEIVYGKYRKVTQPLKSHLYCYFLKSSYNFLLEIREEKSFLLTNIDNSDDHAYNKILETSYYIERFLDKKLLSQDKEATLNKESCLGINSPPLKLRENERNEVNSKSEKTSTLVDAITGGNDMNSTFGSSINHNKLTFKSSYNETNGQIKNHMTKKRTSQSEVFVLEAIERECLIKQNNAYTFIDKNFESLFIYKKEQYMEMFLFELVKWDAKNQKREHQYGKEFFLNEFKRYYKEKLIDIFTGNIVKTIVEIFLIYADNRNNYITKVEKLEQLGNLRFDETKFLSAINLIFQNLAKLAENYDYYLSLHKQEFSECDITNYIESGYFNSDFNSSKLITDFLQLSNFSIYNKATIEILTEKNAFYEILESNSAKIFDFFSIITAGFSEKNIIILSVYMSSYLECIQFSFNNNYSKFFKLKAKNLITNYIGNKTQSYIDKISIMLSGDTWSSVDLGKIDGSSNGKSTKKETQGNGYSFFSKSREKIPFYIKGLLQIFNDNSFDEDKLTFKFTVNKDNVKEKFYKVMSNIKPDIPFPEYSFFYEFIFPEKVDEDSPIYNKGTEDKPTATNYQTSCSNNKSPKEETKESKVINQALEANSTCNNNGLIKNDFELLLKFYNCKYDQLSKIIHGRASLKDSLTLNINSSNPVSNQSNLIFASSAINVLIILEELVTFILLFDEFVFDLFLKIFEIIDFYMVSSILMFSANNDCLLSYNNELPYNKLLLLCFEKKKEEPAILKETQKRSSFLFQAMGSINASMGLFLTTKLGFNLDEVKKKTGVKLETAFENINMFNLVKPIREFLLSIEKNLIKNNSRDNTAQIGGGSTKQNYNCSVHDYLDLEFKNTSSMNKNELLITQLRGDVFFYPFLNTDIDKNCNSERIVASETLHSLNTILHELMDFSERLDLDFQKENIKEKLKGYSSIVETFMYANYWCICCNLFKLENVLSKISNAKIYNWEVKETDQLYDFGEPSEFVKELVEDVSAKMSLLGSYGNCEIKQRFANTLILYISSKLKEQVSKVKKCNNLGRSILLKDAKFMKMNLESILVFSKEKARPYYQAFEEIEHYLNAWYSEKEHLLSYVEETKASYKLVSSICTTGPSFASLNKKEKKALEEQIEEKYIQYVSEGIKEFDIFQEAYSADKTG